MSGADNDADSGDGDGTEGEQRTVAARGSVRIDHRPGARVPTQERHRDGIVVLNRVEHQQFTIEVDSGSRRAGHPNRGITPTPTDPEAHPMPVDATVSFTARQIVFPHVVGTYVREGGQHKGVVPIEAGETEHFDSGEHIIETAAPMKIYFVVEGELSVVSSGEETVYLLEEDANVILGARSLNETPAGTVTIPPGDTDALCAALTAFGAANKAPVSPERSWPTLRGHPPRVEFGEALEVPDALARDDPAIAIQLPRSTDAIYPVAPLAFYLGAEVVPTDVTVPEIRADGHHITDIGPDPEREAARTLRHVLTCDIAVREVGLYDFNTAIGDPVADALPASREVLYEAPPHRRLGAYLSVPHHRIAAHAPEWPAAAHLPPNDRAVRLLPYVLDDLATVHVGGLTPDGTVATDTRPHTDSQHSDGRPTDTAQPTAPTGNPDEMIPADGGSGESELAEGDSALATTDKGATEDESEGRILGGLFSGGDGAIFQDFFRDDRSETFSPDGGGVGGQFVSIPEQTAAGGTDLWAGVGVPFDGVEVIEAAYDHGRRHTPAEDDITVEIVCLDDRMRPELDTASTVYGDSVAADRPHEVNIHTELTTAELRDLFRSDAKFLHYIGHATPEGLECLNGRVDVAEMDDVGVEAFLLNACRSHAQGRALCEAGAAAGVVTTDDLPNSAATRAGRAVARLMNAGFALQSAVDIVGRYVTPHGHYYPIGDGHHVVASSEGRVPALVRLMDAPADRDDTASIAVETHTSRFASVGGLFRPYLNHGGDYFAVPGTIGPIEVGADQLIDFLGREEKPFVYDGDLNWSTDLAFEDLLVEN